ncbi:DUF6709 family protein [Clostridium sp. Marseille-P299]|uniref:DUF6709 family protein n=1 Tax=Clostridium sp. Marseille-P299 TaxID=1805477 RepID=UPI00083502EB|nr:DUF6709 family protein [Clostridium sp. Marseille-P299]
MFKKMRLISAKRVLKSMKAVIIIAIILCFVFAKETISLFQRPKDILTISENNMDNKLVSVEIDAIYTSFMSDKSAGIPANDFLASYNGHKTYFAVQADYRLHNFMSSLQQQTLEMLKGNETKGTSTLKFSGILRKMNTQEKEAFDKYLVEQGIELDASTEILPYILQTTYKAYNDPFILLLWGGSGIVLFLIIIIRVIKALTGGYQRNFKRQLANLNKEQVSYIKKEYEEGKAFQGDIRIGNTYTFCHKGAKTVVFPVEDIQGIYAQKAKIQRKKDEFKNDLFIQVKNGQKYKITGMDTGNIINYYKEKHPEMISRIAYVLDYES